MHHCTVITPTKSHSNFRKTISPLIHGKPHRQLTWSSINSGTLWTYQLFNGIRKYSLTTRWIFSTLIVRARIAKTSFKDSRTTSRSIGAPLKREIATTLFSAPSSSRTFATTCWAINNAQFLGKSTPLFSAF